MIWAIALTGVKKTITSATAKMQIIVTNTRTRDSETAIGIRALVRARSKFLGSLRMKYKTTGYNLHLTGNVGKLRRRKACEGGGATTYHRSEQARATVNACRRRQCQKNFPVTA